MPKGSFFGGPREIFEQVGRRQLIMLLEHGLTPQSDVLDLGCGALRGGYWMIKLLEKGRYCGIEPNEQMLQDALTYILPKEDYEQKKPAFDSNDCFDASIFGRTFDFFIARSIWTHASKNQIRMMLDAFVRYGKADGVFLTSFLQARWWRGEDYQGEQWVGKSHESKDPGMVRHSWRWIRRECESRGLVATRGESTPWTQPWVQRWIIIKKKR